MEKTLKNEKIRSALCVLPLVVVLSLFAIRSYSVGNTTTCLLEPGCTDHSRVGTMTTNRYGFPLVIYEKKVFSMPDGSESSAVTQPVSVVNAVLNIGIVYSIAYSIHRLYIFAKTSRKKIAK